MSSRRLSNAPRRDDSPRRADLTAAETIASYLPYGIASDVWVVVAPLVRSAATAAGGEVHLALWANGKFAEWAYQRGLDIADPEAVYTPNNLDRFVAEGCGGLPGASRSNIRAVLKRTGTAVTTTAPWRAPSKGFARSQVRAPYDLRELALLEMCAAAQTAPLARRAAETLLCLGLGVGPSASELIGITGRSVRYEAGLVCVDIEGKRARSVPVRRAYAERLVALAHAFPAEPLLSPTTATKDWINIAARRIDRGRTTPTFNAARFRSTWLVSLLGDPGVPLWLVLDAAGLKTMQSLGDLVRYLPRTDRGEARERLAGRLDG